MKFEIKDTSISSIKRIIIYSGNSSDDSIGYKVELKDLSSLYASLRDIFKNVGE